MMKLKTVSFYLAALCVGLGIAGPAFADRISHVKIEGVQRIEPATVQSYLTIRPGDEFNPVTINDSMKALFSTGFFSDITFSREGDDLIVSVMENPIINEIAFEGNDRAKDEDLLAETSLRPRVVYTRAKVQEDVQRLLQIYRRMGNYAATIDPKIIQLDQNRVNLVYEIHEGNKTKVRTIKFIGNKHFTEDTLRDAIQTKEARWYRFLSSDDNYDQDRVAYDEELLRKFYLSHGYADFSIRSSIAELTPDQKDFFVTYAITEGERYKLGEVNLESQLTGVDFDALKKSVTTVKGDWYNADKVDTTILTLTDALANQQYAFVDIRPQVAMDRENRIVNLTYNIGESPRVYVERVDIVNNSRTLDEVIRREMLLVEGDPFNRTKLKRSEQKIRDLGFFQSVKVQTAQGTREDLAVITVTVAEQSTGELSIGAGFSTSDGPLADFRIRERNLLGRGQDLELATTVSGRSNNYRISFTEPYFMDRKLSAGMDLFRTTTDYQDISSYDQDRNGAGLRLGYPLSENWRQDLRYTFEDSRIHNIDPRASRYIKDQTGDWMTSAVGHTVTYNTLDSRLDPTEGNIVTLSNDVSGVGGDSSYLATKMTGMKYWPLSDDKNWILTTGGEGGYIFGLSEDVRINERYFIGGNNFRGFDVGGVGARDLLTGDALGANEYLKGTVELTAPFGAATKELGLRTHLFTDVGTVGKIDNAGVGVADDPALRAAVGFGVSWRSPLGPLRGDFAFPVIKEDYDETRVFNFNFGTRF